MNKSELEKQYNDLKIQNEQYQSALQQNHNLMQQIVGKVQLLDEQEKEKIEKEPKPTKKQ